MTDYFENIWTLFENSEDDKNSLVESVFYNHDLIYMISEFLDFEDVLKFGNICKTMRAKSLVLTLVKSRVEKIIRIPEGFSLSGGFLLSVFHRPLNYIDCTDIDLYTNTKSQEETEDIFVGRGFEAHKPKKVYFGNCVWIDKVQSFTNDFLKIDVIYVSKDIEIYSMIHKNFDFSCVKNLYYEEDGKVNLYIKYPTLISRKFAILENFKNTYFRRLFKYLLRGYRIIGETFTEAREVLKALKKISSENSISYFIHFEDDWAEMFGPSRFSFVLYMDSKIEMVIDSSTGWFQLN